MTLQKYILYLVLQGTNYFLRINQCTKITCTYATHLLLLQKTWNSMSVEAAYNTYTHKPHQNTIIYFTCTTNAYFNCVHNQHEKLCKCVFCPGLNEKKRIPC